MQHLPFRTPSSPPFNTLQPWLRARFGRPVHRVALDAGSSCPNRDGTKGFGGCTYCDVEGSGTGALRTGSELEAQLAAGLARVARRGPDVGAIAYFQSYSNTYVAVERLREVLSVVESRLDPRPQSSTLSLSTPPSSTPFPSTPSPGTQSPSTPSPGSMSRGAPVLARPPIVAVSIATRPDTLSEEALDVLAELERKVDVWVELGLETADDEVQRTIRRFHTLADFEDAAARVKQRGLVLVGHAILGLPGDGRAGARNTALALAAAGCDGVKVHHLMVLRRTQMEKPWRAGELSVLDEDTYVDWLADFVERLRPEQVLHRLTGDAPAEDLLAPRWSAHKNAIRARLATELERRGTAQGAHVPPQRGHSTWNRPLYW